ncbi:uncharacterized protein FA14DRAFT_31170 [Meira miltonrushii]|uniref:Uncharacterized protein n=1 Tax=Meira miltonrushii TaxID=1280837 RepID=A0A316VB71_9BASI|nr:uncharacterized protein FA14DRAFT_31170 [Meira miltonrushii]PWN34514.1 hypothetical protein FA14DRAFT_31170 [Meira miltonrushii]
MTSIQPQQQTQLPHSPTKMSPPDLMTAQTPVLTSPGSPTINMRPSTLGRSDSKKRDRRLSRNSRPPHSADGSEKPFHTMNVYDQNAQAGPSNPHHSLHTQQRKELQHSHSLRGDRAQNQRHSHVGYVNLNNETTRTEQSPKRLPSSHQSPNRSSFLALPLFNAEGERARVASSPMTPSLQESNSNTFLSSSTDANRINRSRSMRETTSNQTTEGGWQLPSHHANTTSPTTYSKARRHISPSASMSLISDGHAFPSGPFDDHASQEYLNEDDMTIWARSARRWSSSLPRGRNSAAFAFRLAEGASPYLRAGLEELRSIFDVDSNPIPSSPFIDEEDDDDYVQSGYSSLAPLEESDADRASCLTLSREPSDESREGNRKMTASPAAISSREQSPSRGSIVLQRTPSNEKNEEKSRLQAADKDQGKFNASDSSLSVKEHPPSKTQEQYRKILMPFKRPLEFHTRNESSFGFGFHSYSDGRQNAVNKTFLAWSLSVVAIGIIGLCAWGYATESDAFSITLIGFFLTQPAFALAALTALMFRRRAWMDLFSRAMRAHVLAQALIVLLAYLDLSASSLYSHGSGKDGDSSEQQNRFRMVPTMEMRFGPFNRATEAGDGPGVHFAHHKESAGLAGMSNSSIHAHDSSVGDWRSRLTYFVVFVVQAAGPIIMVLVGQYIIAQRLAILARQGTLSRQSSVRQHSDLNECVSSSQIETKNPSSDGGRSNTAPAVILTGAASPNHNGPTLMADKTRQKPVQRSKLSIHSPSSPPTSNRSNEYSLPSTLQLPIDGAYTGTHPRHRREQRRKRLATAPNIIVGTGDEDIFQGEDELKQPHSATEAPELYANASSTFAPTNSLRLSSLQESLAGEKAYPTQLQGSPVINGEKKRMSKNTMHRHRRSASQPINYSSGQGIISSPSKNISKGLGMMFEEVNQTDYSNLNNE